jgi:predicted nucleotidyltransferase component of viral defense system
MHVENLPKSTSELLEVLAKAESIKPFVLIGGTALSLRHGHRISEDLDFLFAQKPFAINRTLPRSSITKTLDFLHGNGYHARKIEHLGKRHDVLDDGLDLDDYQQDFEVGAASTKITFVCLEDRKLFDATDRECYGCIEIASDAEIFAGKSIVLAQRLRSRDIVDLGWLMEHGPFTVSDIERAFTKADQMQNFDFALSKIFFGKFDARDPGYTATRAEVPEPEQAVKLVWKKCREWLKNESRTAMLVG